VVDKQSYDLACIAHDHLNNFIENVDAVYEPMREAAHAAYKTVLSERDAAKAPAVAAQAELKRKMRGYLQAEEQRLRLEAEEKQRRQDELLHKEKEKEASKLRKKGYSESSIEAMTDAIETSTAMVKVEKVDTGSMSTRTTYSAEVTDLKALIRFVAKSKGFEGLLLPNMTAINSMARGMRDSMEVPGVKVVRDMSLARSRRRA
jgi:hypothetical protein